MSSLKAKLITMGAALEESLKRALVEPRKRTGGAVLIENENRMKRWTKRWRRMHQPGITCGERLHVCPGERHAWYRTAYGPRRKPLLEG